MQKAVHQAIISGVVKSAHDLSEGGLLIAVAEMAFAGGCGAEIDLDAMVVEGDVGEAARAFGETPSRYLLEVEEGNLDAFKTAIGDVPHAVIGSVNDSSQLVVRRGATVGATMQLQTLHEAWAKGCES